MNCGAVRSEERAPAYQALGELTVALGVDNLKDEVEKLVEVVLVGLEDTTADAAAERTR